MRSKLYALSYKALSYAEIQKDLNKEIYKENKTEKAEIGNCLRKSTNHGFRANLFQWIFSSETRKKTASSEGIAESRQKPTAESEIGSEFEKISKKSFEIRPISPLRAVY